MTLKDSVERSDEAALARDIMGFCRERLPGYWVPKSVVFGPLPKTATGKIKKHELRTKAKELGLTPLARIVSTAVTGLSPEIMGLGPVEAIPAVLRHAGLKHEELDWIELNEAFAAQSLAVIRTLGLDPAKVNPMGGAIALGHPLGATGAIRSATVVHALRRKNLKYGMVTMCVGMGQGAAGVFERV